MLSEIIQSTLKMYHQSNVFIYRNIGSIFFEMIIRKVGLKNNFYSLFLTPEISSLHRLVPLMLIEFVVLLEFVSVLDTMDAFFDLPR
jgi:hypothetical protein